MSKIDIIIATFNGENYLREQLDSIINQSIHDFKIYVNDDQSSDGTGKLLKEYESSIESTSYIKCGGAKENFSHLLNLSTGDYVLCSDQDDIWLENRIEKLIKYIKFYENVFGEDMPLLVHTDLILINHAGEKISPSLWRYQNLNPTWGDSFNLLITQNVITGCAMVVNRALLDKALPIPSDAVMHDWWLGLVACSFGKIIWVDEPSVFYRQHGYNEIGAKEFNTKYLFRQLIMNKRHFLHRKSLISKQALAFSERYKDEPQAEIAYTFSQLQHMSYTKRITCILNEGFLKIGLFRNLAWIIRK
ncbi:glycosyltransferase family 2 protein [Deinococcus rubellus]|uniref:Glycosyltransferase family 2 protein n=1 Tax=Deinococcus rubellus TaxID=1889240 RepID=A0ABY5YDK7_9DEIO|nr:glycosyltransferase family 2 protein [Deinococcus rubellus]UWX63150.1 glycosyltransferase family 2 protein [Deinococcus rubellus]